MKKRVAILLAVYEPREDWLIALLDSLNAQTYPALTLYVRDDASPNYPFSDLERLVREHVTAFPSVVLRNEVNLGSNATFGQLVQDCAPSIDYISFCDQDDVWLPEKVADCVHLFENSPFSPILVCSEVTVTDADGNVIARRMSEHRRRHVFLRGEGLAPQLIYRNFAMGCTMLLTRERALSYLPFPEAVVHDHYLAFRAACDGALDYLDEPQLLYRVYGGNQTGVMAGVRTKEDYFRRRIAVFEARVNAFRAVSDLPALLQAEEWCHARVANFRREAGGFRRLRSLRSLNKPTTLFELYGLRMPYPLFRLAILLTQKRFL